VSPEPYSRLADGLVRLARSLGRSPARDWILIDAAATTQIKPPSNTANGEPTGGATRACWNDVLLEKASPSMSAPVLPNPPLSVREVAAHLSITEDVVRYLLRTKKLIGFKAGGQWRIPSESLTEYIINQLANQ